jgi:hypothetical protein
MTSALQAWITGVNSQWPKHASSWETVKLLVAHSTETDAGHVTLLCWGTPALCH